MSAPRTERLAAVAERVVGAARPEEIIDVMVAHSYSTSIKVYDGAVESSTSSETYGAGIRVIQHTDRGPRQGFAHAGSLDDAVIAASISDARDNAAFGEADPHIGLAEPDGLPILDIDQFDDRLAEMSIDDKIATALDLEHRIRSADRRISGVRNVAWSDSSSAVAFATSSGVTRSERGASCGVGAQPMAKDGDETQIGFAGDSALFAGDLDIDRVVRDSVDRATRLLGASAGETAQLTIVLEPRLASTFLHLVASVLNGEAVQKGRSPFAGRLGETIASPLLRLADDPTRRESLGATGWDGEGLATRHNPLIADGVLTQFLHNSYTGRRAGVRSTGSALRGSRSLPGVGSHLLVLEPGAGSWDDLIGGIELGLYVGSFAGLHSGVNPTSGDFSVGADGLMIRRGVVSEPVREVTVASTLQRMLLDVVAVGGVPETLPSGDIVPPLAIEGVSMSGR